MKQWKEPEMSVFSVRMTENIADSGDGGGSSVTYTTVLIYGFKSNNPAEVDMKYSGNFNCNGSQVMDTNIYYTWNSDGKAVVKRSDWNHIQGCRV